MPIFTNKTGLPGPLYSAICADSYNPGESDISTTGLSVPSKIWALRKIHGDTIEVDAADRIFSLIGQVGHRIAERLGDDHGYIVEKRYYMDFDGVKVGGQIDLYEKANKTLWDYKFCSYHVTKDGVKDEWQQQASVNKLLLEENGIQVDAVKYVGIFRDWSAMRAGQCDMPEKGCMVFSIAPWPKEQTVAWIKERIASHKAALVSLPECTEEERWAKEPQWAHMRKGNKRAIKLYPDILDARTAIAKDSAGYLEERPGSDVRCENYCEVRQFCTYAQLKGYAK